MHRPDNALKERRKGLNIYKNVKDIADKRGISIYQIEQTNGIGNGTISGWTEGKDAKVTTVKKVADYLGVSMEELIRS